MYQYSIDIDKITNFLDALDEGEPIMLEYVSKDNKYVIYCDLDPETFSDCEIF